MVSLKSDRSFSFNREKPRPIERVGQGTMWLGSGRAVASSRQSRPTHCPHESRAGVIFLVSLCYKQYIDKAENAGQ
ncbi:hypothetical protein [Chroococcidiopsis sp. CCMEE 29]|uniref:hypothetical protein n=1 Tax=Chroococcidiopsis sp. CCMEE 29 TaxID=155894 RepID=UPI00202140DB|nr:hypothetical protein [Chroococcidiopsis sp. CCMEE 29]